MNKQKQAGRKTLGLTLGICITGFFACSTASAQDWHGHEQHPAYLRALDDLRAARWMMENRPGNWVQAEDERAAEKEVNEAIREIKEAAVDDGKGTGYHPVVDERPDHGGRLHAAQDFLRRAKEDLAHEEDNGYARGLRNRSFQHIDFAQQALGRAIAIADREARPVPPPPPPPPNEGRRIEAPRQMPVQHPAYIHALEDLRAARWMIEHRPGNWEQGREEHEAVREIEAALREIKEAAIDDGKGMDDHPQVDERPDHGGRLSAATDFLRKAREDIAHGEDDAFANRLRERSFRHIDAALDNIERTRHNFR